MKHLYSNFNKLFVFVFFLTFNLTFGQDFVEIKKAVAPDRESPDLFGYSVAIDNNYAVVGAYQQKLDVSGLNSITNAGAAYIFQKDNSGNWNQIQKIVASDRESSDRFGRSVSISGDYIVVGAYQEDDDVNGNNSLNGAGSAYIFKRDVSDTWIEIQKIVASDRNSSDRFGQSVSMDGDYLIVGANLEDEDVTGNNTLSSSGSAYLFEKDGSDIWNEVQKLTASDRQSGDLFGWSVSISGDYAVVGAYNEDEDELGSNTLNNSGSAYVFERNGTGIWNEVKKIVASNRSAEDNFGYSVAIENDIVVIGSIGEDEDASELNTLINSGAVYIFNRENSGDWLLNAKRVALDRSDNDSFGNSVSLSGSYLAVGANDEDEDGNGMNTLSDAGSAYLFEFISGNWQQVQKLNASDRGAGDIFGAAISIDNENLIIGAHREDEDENGMNTLSNAGAIYFFENSASLGTHNDFVNSFLIYPNPTQGKVFFKLKEASELKTISIYDLTGRLITDKVLMINSNSPIPSMNLEKLPAGNYFIEVNTNNGKSIKQLIKY
ncbi:T9SS type A sorting domain-containing protein [Hanstruepera marina]|uniref:T9SS type A sorting domain-containing protein n=1 Tax=Hanstruepera marina TaxID=2873265 RepID=UPI001CA7605E|nr:T9SS type A sorting domain-containing protein [Hanstruepera marina]